jgi:hypothetical protein
MQAKHTVEAMMNSKSGSASSRSEDWPELDYGAAAPTYATQQLWMQIVGKIRLAQSPWVNHSWHVPLYLTARGLTSSPIPYDARTFQIDFDLVEHRLVLQSNDGATRMLALRPGPVAGFYRDLLAKLAELGLDIELDPVPCEMADATPFDRDEAHRAYDAGHANRLWRAMTQADRVLKIFRSRFAGKCSPVHFFWGGFDLAVARFSGRPAPAHPGGIPHLADWIVRDAYSHEVSSAGFWPGGEPAPFPLFYSYAYPEPPGFGATPLRVPGAGYNTALREFVLPYDEVRLADSPDVFLLEFLENTYDAAASLGQWDRAGLEYRKRLA